MPAREYLQLTRANQPSRGFDKASRQGPAKGQSRTRSRYQGAAILLSAGYLMRCAVRLSIHASDKAFTAPKLNLIAIEKLLRSRHRRVW